MSGHRILPFLTAIAAALLLAGASRSSAQTTAMEAYEHAQNLRHQEAAPLIQGSDANPDSIRKGIEILEGALDYLDEPAIRDLSYGNVYLRFRRFDVHRDLALAHAKLGENDRAIEHIRGVLEVGTGESVLKWLDREPGLADLRETEAFLSLRAGVAAETRIATGSSLRTRYKKNLSDAEKIAGLSTFWSRARADFVYFDQVPDLDWDRAYMDAIPRVLATKSTMDYYLELMRFAALLGDGHTNAYPPPELRSKMYSRPPMRTRLIEDKVLVTEVYSEALRKQGLEVGTEIVSVDGLSPSDYVAKNVNPYVSSSTSQDREKRCYSYHFLAGPEDASVALELVSASGESFARDIARGGYTDESRPARNAFRELDGGFTYLALDHFESDEPVKAFLAAFDTIRASKGLVLDLRRNGGGNTEYGYEILSRIVDRPFYGERTRHRVRDSLYSARARGSIEWQVNQPRPRPPKEGAFLGPVAVLIGPDTFSAAEDFVVAFDDADRGPLVGRATGGSTGQPLMFSLPGGGSARICVKRDTYADGREFVGYGIAPDIEVAPTVESVRAGRDLELEAAVAALRKAAGSGARD